MKKTLATLAVLGAFASSAFAANVTLYGLVDTGFSYYHTDDGVNDATDEFKMSTGANSASRFGLKGVEELGNGLKVGFVLENGFKSDTGAMSTNGDLFDREALLFVEGAYGQLGMGRVGQLASGNGTYGLFGGKVAPMSTGWDKIAGHKYVMGSGFGRLDNAVTYKSPSFAGFNVLAQYSFDTGSATGTEAKPVVEGESSADREYAVGVTYAAGPMYIAGIVTQTNLRSVDNPDVDDPLQFSLGGHYNFGVLKAYAAAQYFQDSKLTIGAINDVEAVAQHDKYAYDGFGLHFGVDVPAFGGTAKVGMGYMDAEDQIGDLDMQRYTFAVGYEYPLSKRTFVYGGAGYYQDCYDAPNADDASVTAVNMGLVHKF